MPQSYYNYNYHYHKANKKRINARHKKYRLTLRGKIVELLKHCRARSECTLNVDSILKLWESQIGRCALTNQAMTYNGKLQPLTLSLDRIDTAKGYVDNNVRLVCFWANCARGDLDDQTFKSWCRRAIAYKTQKLEKVVFKE